MKKFFKTFLAANLSLFIAMSLFIAPVYDNNNNYNSPITPLNDLTDPEDDLN